jgi:hypothetical protein
MYKNKKCLRLWRDAYFVLCASKHSDCVINASWIFFNKIRRSSTLPFQDDFLYVINLINIFFTVRYTHLPNIHRTCFANIPKCDYINMLFLICLDFLFYKRFTLSVCFALVQIPNIVSSVFSLFWIRF